MVTTLKPPATLDDLARVPEKAELIGGQIVYLMPTGRLPGRVASRIYQSLDQYAATTGHGEACPDNVGCTVPALRSGRQSFAPDAFYYDQVPPGDPMRFALGAPTFAVEVRSENDYGPAAEEMMADKRGDYFEAGTRLVWDVDPVGKTIHAYAAAAASPEAPAIFHRGDTADAGNLLPGWSVSVDALFV